MKLQDTFFLFTFLEGRKNGREWEGGRGGREGEGRSWVGRRKNVELGDGGREGVKEREGE